MLGYGREDIDHRPGMSPTATTDLDNIRFEGRHLPKSPEAIPSTRRMSFVNVLSREKQIEVIAALCEGVGMRTAARLTGVNRGTVGRLALRVGRGCMELHDRMMVGIRTERLELDEAWSFVGKKQKNVKRHEINAKGDQYVFIGMAGTQKAIISWGVGKRNMESPRWTSCTTCAAASSASLRFQRTASIPTA